MMSAPMPIIIEHVDSMVPANIGVTKKNLTDDQPLSAEKPKKKVKSTLGMRICACVIF